MTRNLRALGVCLVAVFAVSGVGASGALAVPQFHSENATTIVTAGGKTLFSTKVAPSLEVTCEGDYAGTQTGTTAASLTVHPVYSDTGCTSSIGSATVDTDGCDYVLYGETTTRIDTSGAILTDAPVEIECTTGKNIIITASCNITITSAAGEKLHGIKYTNTGSGSTRDIDITVTIDNLKYTTPNTLACNLIGLPRNGTDGTLTWDTSGDITAKGSVDGAFSKNATTHKVTVTEGAQVGIWWE